MEIFHKLKEKFSPPSTEDDDPNRPFFISQYTVFQFNK